MKILHINSYYSTSKFYKNLYENQIKSELDIDVFVPVPSTFENNDFDYGEYSKISKNHNKNDRYIFHLKHNKIYYDVQQKYNIKEYSVIHAHSLFSNGYVAMKLKRQYGIPYIVAVRNTDVNLFFKKMIHLRKLGINILKEANQIIFLSNTYKDQVIEKYIPKQLQDEVYNKVSVISNGIDNFWFDNIGLPQEKPKLSNLKLLQVGDINKNKNIETTIKAIDLLISKGYNIKLDMVGKVKDQKIFNRIRDLDYVNYLGYKPKEDLINIYRNNNIFILPSIHETFGLVYAEAMSQGLPVIYSRGQGFDGQFKDGEVGYSVQHDSTEEITKKIEKILDNYSEMSKRCLLKVEKFNWYKIAKKYFDIYNCIIV
jgi:glycosyltransferase involved in cell wall biosynthesis